MTTETTPEDQEQEHEWIVQPQTAYGEPRDAWKIKADIVNYDGDKIVFYKDGIVAIVPLGLVISVARSDVIEETAANV